MNSSFAFHIIYPSYYNYETYKPKNVLSGNPFFWYGNGSDSVGSENLNDIIPLPNFPIRHVSSIGWIRVFKCKNEYRTCSMENGDISYRTYDEMISSVSL